MPSGGGVVGGGGGFASTAPYVGFSSDITFTGSYGGEGGKMSKGGWMITLCVVMFMVILTAGTMIGVGVGVGARYRRRGLFSPGDSRLLTTSSFFCQGGTLELSSSSVDAQLYSVNTVPPLNDKNNFTITLSLDIGPGEYRFWQYYLYPNSSLKISARANVGVDVYIVKGDKNSDRWVKSPRASVAVRFYTIELFSPDILFQVNEADEYYVYFYKSPTSSRVIVTGSLYFERFEYSAPTDLVESCNVSKQGQCTIGIPYSTGLQQFLVLTSIPENVDYGENVELTLSCSQRGWTYAVTVLVPLIATIVVTVGGLMLCYGCCKRCGSVDKDLETTSVASEMAPLSENEEV